MTTKSERPSSSTMASDEPSDAASGRVVPVTESKGKGKERAVSPPPPPPPPPQTDAMDISPSDDNSADLDHNNHSGQNGNQESKSSPPEASSSSMAAPPSSASAGSAQQPKIVQTAFIHKLYNMLEDNTIQNLISWSPTADSFVMSPSADFSKVLSQYFKHTNISSFVRQLNMYGFHKERDVFHTGNPDGTLWEFKHGNGNFRRGDINGLREIRRRASKHTPIPKESTYAKPSSSLPGTPAEPSHVPLEGTDARLANLEHTIYDMSARLHRSEESAHYMHIKNLAMVDHLNRLLHFNQELSRSLLAIAPPESAAYRDVLAVQAEMQRQSELIRAQEDHDPPPSSSSRAYLGNVDNAPPVSPRQLPQDDSRRPPIPQIRGATPYRPHVSSNLSAGSRRPYGSISGSSPNQSSPLRNAAPAPPPPTAHLLPATDFPGNMGRRHTSADIREHGWQPANSSYSGSNPPSGPWPSSPNRNGQEDHQRLRESLSSYSLQGATRLHPHSRPTTPPPPAANGATNGNGDSFANWTWNSASSRDGRGAAARDGSAPPTRRGSMAHILNPSNGAGGSEEDDDTRGDDDRKRKRMQ